MGGYKMDKIEQKLSELGHKFRSVAPKKIEGAKLVGNLLFVSGHGPKDADETLRWVGRVGAEVSVEEAYHAAERCAVNCLGAAKRVIGDLEKVEEVIKVLGFINSAEHFHDQPSVMNGCTDLLVKLFGEKGRHTRAAIGTSNLPHNQPVEVEMILRVRS